MCSTTNRSISPASTAIRTVTFTVSDGTDSSNTLSRDIALAAVNDAPVLAAIEGSALPYTENGPATIITGTLTASDPDDTHLTGATVRIKGNYQSAEDLSALTDPGTITETWDAATGTLTLSGSDTLASYQTALRAVTYHNTSEGGSRGHSGFSRTK